MAFGKNTRRILVLVALVAATLIPSGLYLSTQVGEAPRAESAQTLLAMISNCIPANVLPGRASGSQVDCARQVVLRYAEDSTAAEINQALDAPYREVPGFANVCHDITHEVGKMLARRDGLDYAATVAEISSVNCVTGMMHGYLEVVATKGVDSETVSTVIKTCGALATMREKSGCADGVGHMLWIMRGDFGVAAQQCTEFESAWLNMQCSYGVIMLAALVPPNAPAGTRSPIAPETMVSVCAKWPVSGDIGQYGCGQGVGFILSNAARPTYLAMQDAGRALGDGSVEAIAVEDIFTQSVGLCINLASISARIGCLSDTVRNTITSHEVSFGVFDDFCQFFPAAYAIACPDKEESASPWVLYDHNAHGQVAALLNP